LCGGKFVDEAGDLNFPESVLDRKDQSYRTRFGPAVETNGNVFDGSNISMKYAVRRLTGLRFPDKPGEDEAATLRQELFIQVHSAPLEAFFNSHLPDHNTYLNIENEALLHHNDPHPKRALRLRAYLDSVQDGTHWQHVWMRVGKMGKLVLYKAKKDEVAKPNKYLRAIGDLGVFASLEGAWLSKMMKDCIDQKPFHYAGGTLTFIQKPTPSVLDGVFADLIDPKGRFAFYFHSDDSCVGIRCNGEIYRYNLDISGCDASHSKHMFSLLETLAGPHRADMKRLVDQCRLPFEVRSAGNRRHRVIFGTKDGSPRLYSGSTITTCLNNGSNELIGMAIGDTPLPTGRLLFSTPFGTLNYGRLHVESAILAAIHLTGYVCTLEYCALPEDLQFLKNSPIACTDGERHAMLNLGVLLRASGTCRQDLPGRGDLRTRGKKFQAALLHGFYPTSDCSLIRMMKHAAGPHDTAFDKYVLADTNYKTVNTEIHTYLDESVYRRYRLTVQEIGQVEEFAQSDYGYFCANPGLSAILRRDYGLQCLNRVPQQYLADPRR
jgi:hypothetical protein